MSAHALLKRNEGFTMNIFSKVDVKFLAMIYTILEMVYKLCYTLQE